MTLKMDRQILNHWVSFFPDRGNSAVSDPELRVHGNFTPCAGQTEIWICRVSLFWILASFPDLDLTSQSEFRQHGNKNFYMRRFNRAQALWFYTLQMDNYSISYKGQKFVVLNSTAARRSTISDRFSAQDTRLLSGTREFHFIICSLNPINWCFVYRKICTVLENILHSCMR